MNEVVLWFLILVTPIININTDFYAREQTCKQEGHRQAVDLSKILGTVVTFECKPRKAKIL